MDEIVLCNGRVVVRQGDITKIEVDAVVNAANSGLMGGGGVDGAIHRAGGPAILNECRELRRTRFPDGLPSGEAVSTPAGDLPAQVVIHSVGPVWKGGEQNEAEILKNCYINALKTAALLGVRSIAFPSISTGIYGYPREKAAIVVSKAVFRYLGMYAVPEKVMFIFFSDRDLQIFMEYAEFSG